VSIRHLPAYHVDYTSGIMQFYLKHAITLGPLAINKILKTDTVILVQLKTTSVSWKSNQNNTWLTLQLIPHLCGMYW